MRQISINVLKNLQHENSLFSAANKNVKTGYHRAWIRDNIYQAIGMEVVNPQEAIKTYHTLLNILLKHEGKIDHAIKEKPEHSWQYIHARYEPSDLNEIWEDWGNKQNDAIGAFLFKIADLTKKGHDVLRNYADWRIIQKLILYLESIEYWHDKDHGIWENEDEIHASSIGACVAGIKLVEEVFRTVHVPKELIKKGQDALNALLPKESVSRHVDLALLSLIYPYNIVTPTQREEILKNVEQMLVREKGVVRYFGDWYYENDNGEAEWTMGFPWLAIIYKNNDVEKYTTYMAKTFGAMNEKGELPELYFSGTNVHNENTPLGWSQALLLVAME